jgi:alcohol dehydrogenase YqhD (iron-dependent ADH family)
VFYEGDNLWEMVRTASHLRKALPLVDILTLSATGSEFDNSGVISNLKTNEKLGGLYTFPSVSICDPTYTFSVPKYQTAAGAADIMSHIFENYFSRTEDSDLSDGISETILMSTMKNVMIALEDPEDYNARANLMANSSVACSGIPAYGKQGTGWPCHAMEHELSAFYDITHGVGLAILTPRWMRFILKKDPSCLWRFTKMARNVFGLESKDENELAQKGIDALEAHFRSTGIPMSLKELNIDETHFREMAEHAVLVNRLSTAFVPLTADDIVEIYRTCL